VPLGSGSSPSPPIGSAALPKQSAPATPPARVGAQRDPVAAAVGLLSARRACLAAGRPACLAGVDAAGSPAAELDVAAVTAGVEPVAVPAGTPRLRSRSGGTAVLVVRDVTVLIVQQPDGWRLRDVVRGPPR
jgi:hypothetical protein